MNNDMCVMVMTLLSALLGVIATLCDKSMTKHERLMSLSLAVSVSHTFWCGICLLLGGGLTAISAVSLVMFVAATVAALKATELVDSATSKAHRRANLEARIPNKLLPMPCMGPVVELEYKSLPVPVQPSHEYIMAVKELDSYILQSV